MIYFSWWGGRKDSSQEMPIVFREDSFQNKTSDEIIISGRKNYRFQKNQRALLSRQVNQDIEFHESCVVQRVKKRYLEDEDVFEFRITLSSRLPLKEQSLLSNLSFSLEKIYRYGNPYEHFKRKITRISDKDYEVIVQNDIDFPRTTFGKIVNSLHPEHRSQFYELYLEKEAREFSNYKDYSKALRDLKKYVENYVVKSGEYLRSAFRIFKELPGVEGANEIAFGSEQGMPTIISTQVKLFELFFESWTDAWPALFSEISIAPFSSNNVRRNFDRKPWPIDHD